MDTDQFSQEPTTGETNEISIRAYERRDRSAIRRICCDTAARGEPVEHLFPDREVFADFVTGYYADYEPGSSWVAERDGQVVGYVTGCLDTRRYLRMMAWRIIPRASLRALSRGVLWCSQTWRLLWAAIKTWRLGGFNRRLSLEQYPAHLHVNMQRGLRGQHVGQHLVERFIQHAFETGRGGVHVFVRGDNAAACRFFERLGFLPLDCYPVVLPEDHIFQHHETIFYGKRL